MVVGALVETISSGWSTSSCAINSVSSYPIPTPIRVRESRSLWLGLTYSYFLLRIVHVSITLSPWFSVPCNAYCKCTVTDKSRRLGAGKSSRQSPLKPAVATQVVGGIFVVRPRISPE